jgi:hypothetical protein
MPKLSIIVGMAGSGKSTVCNEIVNQSSSPAFAFPTATLTNNDKRRAGHQSLGEMVARLLGRSEDCVMDEAHLTVPEFRTSFKQFCDVFLVGIEPHWIFFEADVVACINNVYHDAQGPQGRRDLCRFKALDAQRTIYKVPNKSEFPNHTVRAVYKQEHPQFSDESTAVAWLESEIEALSPSQSNAI